MKTFMPDVDLLYNNSEPFKKFEGVARQHIFTTKTSSLMEVAVGIPQQPSSAEYLTRIQQLVFSSKPFSLEVRDSIHAMLKASGLGVNQKCPEVTPVKILQNIIRKRTDNNSPVDRRNTLKKIAIQFYDCAPAAMDAPLFRMLMRCLFYTEGDHITVQGRANDVLEMKPAHM